MESTVFDTLYTKDKNGKIKEWSINVINKNEYSEIFCSYGYKDGKKSIAVKKITHGKNIGKKNETTHYQQAILEATSKWKKKKETDQETDQNTPLSILPMLAQDYKKYNQKIVYPCFCQPKLDGYRMIYNSFCFSRTGKEYTILRNSKLMYQLTQLNELNLILDGELYVHDPAFNFENYGVLRKQKLKDADLQKLDKIQYHIYDIIDYNKTFEERLHILNSIKDLKNKFNLDLIQIVDTVSCQNKDDINQYHMQIVNRGYEGSIIRNKNGMYKCQYRSYDLQKYKDFDDDEFEITDYTYETDVTGNDQKVIIWICKTKDGKTFNVPSKGTRKERNELYLEGSKYIGKKLWVQYFGLTADNIPRFPKTQRAGIDAIRMEKF
jgi:DNA ligase-1